MLSRTRSDCSSETHTAGMHCEAGCTAYARCESAPTASSTNSQTTPRRSAWQRFGIARSPIARTRDEASLRPAIENKAAPRPRERSSAMHGCHVSAGSARALPNCMWSLNNDVSQLLDAPRLARGVSVARSLRARSSSHDKSILVISAGTAPRRKRVVAPWLHEASSSSPRSSRHVCRFARGRLRRQSRVVRLRRPELLLSGHTHSAAAALRRTRPLASPPNHGAPNLPSAYRSRTSRTRHHVRCDASGTPGTLAP